MGPESSTLCKMPYLDTEGWEGPHSEEGAILTQFELFLYLEI